jgi:hypothetical protein
VTARIRKASPTSSPDSLLLDEMYPPRIASLLAKRHIDCVAVADDHCYAQATARRCSWPRLTSSEFW